MSSGADNSIKHWIFDGPDAEAGRLLRFRSGHSAPPTCVLHYGQVCHCNMTRCNDGSHWVWEHWVWDAH